MDLRSDLSELAIHLRQERLYVNSEREQLQKLFDDVKKEAEDLYHTSWIAQQQRLQLKQMLFSPHSTTQNCFLRVNCIEGTNFVDSYKYLSYHDTKYGEFLKFLRENPQLIAHCIHAGEKTDQEGSRQMVDIVLSSLYGNCILQEDEVYTLHLLKTLTELQLVSHNNPRQLLRRGSCAVSFVFKHLCDSIFSVKLFLTAALHDPVMRLLMEDEWFYDIDPDKALVRFPPHERLRRFGQPGSDEYIKKLQEYRKFIVDKLVLLATRFINSVQNNFHCFPPSLNWLMSQIYQLLTDCGKFDASEIRAVCADLVFALFICPAICDPEPYGITSDVPISHISRHNLMQMANILQVLAISQYEEIDPKVKDLYSRFDKNCMSSFLDGLLQNIRTDLPSCSTPQLQLSSRNSVLLPLTQLNSLVEYLKKVIPHLPDTVALKKQLEGLVSDLQIVILPSATSPLTSADTPTPATPTTAKKLFKTKKNPMTPSTQDNQDDSSSQGDANDLASIQKNPNQQEDVLVVSLGITLECPGMMSEQKVLSWEQDDRRTAAKYDNLLPFSGSTSGMPEKRTRFSLSNDQESIGNTSDIQEAVSEAASSHSVGSADLETDINDNFSDMISANVSGRGTPNISGRDTPLSHAESVEETRPSDLPDTVQKNNREDVTERFGKFEIKAELEPDMKSTVSDTWSTDVLASDSEPPDQNQLERLEEVAEEMMRQNLLPINISSIEPLSELSETASDAWSTDVLASASDTEEKQADLLDFDQDDAVSNIDNPSGLASADKSNGRPASSLDQHHGNRELEIDSGVFDSLSATASENPPKHKSIADDAFSSHPHNDRFAQNHPPRHRKYLNVPKRSGSSGSSQKGDNIPTSSQNNTVDVSAYQKGPQKFTSSITIPPTNSPSILKVNGPSLESGNSDRFDVSTASASKDFKKYDHTPIQNTVDSENKDSSEQTDDLDIFEQANSKIDQTRLSVALGMFDPLITEDVLCEDTASTPFTSESAAKLKANNTLTDVPNTLASGENQSSKSLDSLKPGKDKRKPEILFSEEGEEVTTKRWSSSDSSHSTTSSNICESQESVQAAGLTPSKDDEKESSDTDMAKSSEKMKKSLISSFKEKLSKSVKKKGGPKLAILESSQINHQESSDEILARYRKKPQSNAQVATAGLQDVNPSSLQEKRISISKENEQNQALFYDPNNVESCFAFLDAKRKLRMVLSTGEFQSSLSSVHSESDAVAQSQHGSYLYKRESEVVNFLRAQLAEATNLQNKDMIAQLHEAVRCLRMFEPDGCRKIVQSLRDDYHTRSSYIAYLVRCRQGLLMTLSHLQRLHNRNQRYKEISNKHLTNVCVRLFIEKHEKEVLRFMSDFQRLTVPDEKTDLVEQFFDEMYSQIERHQIWHAATDFQLEDARLALERYLMSRIYTHAMFPNGDGDILRDQLFHQHIKKLSPIITPNHKDLRIPQIYHYECPWPAAQREIYMINAYKTAKDKLQKVIRCSTTIMNLLSMANEKSVPAADDFMPVLIYVLIKANPPYLLSTIQYVTSFYEKRLAGEEQYWWMQFSSAVEFIKTMDYNR